MLRATGRTRKLRLSALLLTLAAVAGALLFVELGFADGASAQLGPSTATRQVTPGVGNDAALWRAVHSGVSGWVSIPDRKAGLLIQPQGETWRAVRNGPLLHDGAYLLGAVVVALAIFFLWRGRIRVEDGFSGRTVTRFGPIERFAHWLIAVSFVVLGLTGLNITFGRHVLMPLIGQPTFAAVSLWAKYLHNFVAFAFIAGLVVVFVRWVTENIPDKYDAGWLLRGGGMFAKGVHPPAKKFNAGQKILFWLIVLGGGSLAASGLDLLFPFQLAMFSKTFVFLNLFGANLPTNLAPVHEMQLASIWHAILALLMIALILGHVYIGTLGMEGAFDAMGTGEVDVSWAREHHSVWAERQAARDSQPVIPLGGKESVTPAE